MAPSFDDEQKYGRPPLGTQIQERLQRMSKVDKAQVIAVALTEPPYVDYIKDVAPLIEDIKKARLEEEQRRLTKIKEAEERINHPCFRFLEAYFRTIKFREKDALRLYHEMKSKDLATLLNQLKTYECYRKDFNDIKPQALDLLRRLSIDKQAEEITTEESEKPSLLKRFLE